MASWLTWVAKLQAKSFGDLTLGGKCSLSAVGRILSLSFIICKRRAISIPIARAEGGNPYRTDQACLSARLACVSKHISLPALVGPLLTADRSATDSAQGVLVLDGRPT